jgi:hypothetical protein
MRIYISLVFLGSSRDLICVFLEALGADAASRMLQRTTASRDQSSMLSLPVGLFVAVHLSCKRTGCSVVGSD